MGQTTTFLTLAALVLSTIGMAALIYQILRQQGRLLLRLEQIEQHLRDSTAPGTAALPVGTALPDFELPDLDGRPVTLSGLQGQRALLVNWSARCGYCELIAPDLGRMLPDLEKAGVRLLLVGHAAADAERKMAEEHDLQGAVLLDSGSAIEAFASLGTPAAYLLDGEGRIASPLAIGSDHVLDLAGTAVPASGSKPSFGSRDVGRSRIERNGLKPGTPAPAFDLPEVRGGRVSLDEYRGRKVLLVFSDPHCGPCQDLAPHLTRLSEEHRGNGLAVVMVGRGEAEENRRKAEELGLEFPVAVQRGWELSKSFGIFSTPVAFLIDEQGVIAKEVARGTDGILDLLSEPLVARQEVAHG